MFCAGCFQHWGVIANMATIVATDAKVFAIPHATDTAAIAAPSAAPENGAKAPPLPIASNVLDMQVNPPAIRAAAHSGPVASSDCNLRPISDASISTGRVRKVATPLNFASWRSTDFANWANTVVTGIAKVVEQACLHFRAPE
jgi:hypothetical protein